MDRVTTTPAPEERTSVARFVARISANIETVIIGKRREIDHLLVALLCRGHVLLEDVPGTGKTMLARATAGSVGLAFNRIQCTPDLLPNDITGTSVYNQQSGQFEFRPGPIFVNILLADEINRATPRTQSALLEAMQEHQVTVDGTTYPLSDPFIVLGTQNPVEYEGTFPLPEAQLDRFLIRMPLGYLQEADEVRMMRHLRRAHPIDQLCPVVASAELPRLYDEVADVHVDASLEEYIAAVVAATRSHPDLALGASARGTLALYKTSQALAAVCGRDYVIPEDVKEMARLTLPHRLLVNPDSELRGRDATSIVNGVLGSVPIPREGDALPNAGP